MATLKEKLQTPKLVAEFGLPCLDVGVTLLEDGRQFITTSNYWDPGFSFNELIYDPKGELQVTWSQFDYRSQNRGAKSVDKTWQTLFKNPGGTHDRPKAAKAQFTSDGKTVYYQQYGGWEIGRLDLEHNKVLPPYDLGGMVNHFHRRNNGEFVTLERSDQTGVADLSLVTYALNGVNTLQEINRTPLGVSGLGGICELDGDLLILVPEISTVKQGPGIYHFDGNSLVKHYEGVLPRSKGLALIHDVHQGKAAGFLVTTWPGAYRNKTHGGVGKAFYLGLPK
jgi:hypothetical protein